MESLLKDEHFMQWIAASEKIDCQFQHSAVEEQTDVQG